MMEKNIGMKEKWTNKGTDKQYAAESLIHDTTYLLFVTNFKILGQIVTEKSLTKRINTKLVDKKTIFTPL